MMVSTSASPLQATSRVTSAQMVVVAITVGTLSGATVATVVSATLPVDAESVSLPHAVRASRAAATAAEMRVEFISASLLRTVLIFNRLP